MAAHPKNKITRVEQGKRRAGNTPKLKKDTRVAKVPGHKKSLYARIFALFETTTTAPAPKAKAKKAAPSTANTGVNPGAAQRMATQMMAAKKTARTQHKGG